MNQPTPTPIQAVIFDLGGVIIRTDQRAPRAALAARFGMTYEELDRVVFSTPLWQQAETGQATEEDAWAEIGRAFQLDESGLKDFQRQFFAGDFLDEALVAVIRGLRGPYKTGLLSNNWIADLGGWLERRYGLTGLFDDIISSAQVGLSKPGPDIYRLACQRLAVAPQQAVFVDDAPWNIDGARAVGMHAIRFVSTAQLEADLSALLGHPLARLP